MPLVALDTDPRGLAPMHPAHDPPPRVPLSAVAAPPRLVSVIVRSYNRLPTLCELVAALLAQDTPGINLEVVVVEQSTSAPAAARAQLAELERDPRLRVLRHPPLGGPRARNVGVRAAGGDVLLFMDDDDLPDGPGWVMAHLRNYEDPACLGVSGRHVLVGDEQRAPYADMDKARRQVLSYVPWLRWPRVRARADRRRKVEHWMGGNSSLRRSAIERFGLWDECTTIEDELSFCYRLNAGKRPEEYLVFDPEAPMRRRLDVPGGMDKRAMTATRFLSRMFTFEHHIIAHYFPVRFVALYPAYVVTAYVATVDWVWNEFTGRGAWPQRLARSVGLLAALPVLWTAWLARFGFRRLTRGPLPRATSDRAR